MRRFLKLALTLVLLALLTIALSYSWLVNQVGGAFDNNVDQNALSPDARTLIAHAFSDLEPARLRDYHVHIVGVDSGASGTWINPKLMSWRHLVDKVKGDVYFSSCGITDRDHTDEQYFARLRVLTRDLPGKFHLLAFDHHYDKGGRLDLIHSEFYTPNDYVTGLSRSAPDRFVPVISLHPYRRDALEQLSRWAAQGVRYVKWLPNAQGIDAEDPRALRFYSAMRDFGMALLTHVGEEQAVQARDAQALGNPLNFRAALDAGVKVIMAHSASLGEDEDIDTGGQRSSFDLFLTLMDRPQYRGLLFGEISAMTQFNRLPDPILTLLRRTDLHDRIVNGSDYPLPAVNVLIQTSALVRYGLIDPTQRLLLNEIYRYNPLLFDFVLKRTIRSPETKKGFPAQVFMTHPQLPQ